MRKKENNGFICKCCQKEVLPVTNGSYRNHCPFCLYSIHIDIKPGDRLNNCLGLMSPIDYRIHSKKGYQILHECDTCGHHQWNKIAENTVQNDYFLEWIKQENKN